MIVLIDDDAEDLMINQAILRRSGFSSRTFQKTKAAIEYLKSHVVEAVLVDMRMPDMSGIDLLRYLKKHVPTTRVIFLTGCPKHLITETEVEFLMDGYLEKPLCIKSLSVCLGLTPQEIAS